MTALKPANRLLRRVRAELYSRRYGRLLKRLRALVLRDPNYRVRVAFLVNDNTKWNCQSIYEAMAAHPRFEPAVVVCKQKRSALEDRTRVGYEDDLRFFRDRGLEILEAYDAEGRRNLPLADRKFDLAFYVQPWGFEAGVHDLPTLAQSALTCSVPYSLPVANDLNDFNLSFHNMAWRIFLPAEENLIDARAWMDNRGANCRVTGYPKLDDYGSPRAGGRGLFKEPWGKPKRLIYAPHHSFHGRLSYATFRWSGSATLAMAKEDRSLSWVFKPHPRLKYELVSSGIMGLEEADRYYADWEALPNGSRYERGDYIGLFEESDGLVTDCASFLGEYLPTGKPVFLLASPNSAGYNTLGKSITSAYYRCGDEAELRSAIRNYVRGDDLMLPARLKAMATLVSGVSAAARIIGTLEEELGMAPTLDKQGIN